MEFVKVTYPTVRRVNVDGGPCGDTGAILKTSAGTHDFDLGAPLDYTPSSQTIQVRNTSKASPLIVAFLPIEVAIDIPEEVLGGSPARRRKVARRAGHARREKPGAVSAPKAEAEAATRKSAAKTASKKSTSKTALKKSASKTAPNKPAAKKTSRKSAAKTAVETFAKKSPTQRKSARKRVTPSARQRT